MEESVAIKEEILEFDDNPENIKQEYNEDYLDEEYEDNEENEENLHYEEQDLLSSENEQSDDDYVYKKRKRKAPKRKARNKDPLVDEDEEDENSDRIPCKGCSRSFGSQGNLNKHLGHFRSCRGVYEDLGELPACFQGPKRRTVDGKFPVSNIMC